MKPPAAECGSSAFAFIGDEWISKDSSSINRFVWSKFPTIEFVKQLRETDLVIAHGAMDRIVPGSHSIEIEKAYKGEGRVLRLKSQIAGHNMAFYDLKDELKKAITILL
ncbi:MAG: hypothetical protein J5J00_08085 [Deltaproteobacteria bacterium]|nr:hypothetical protein [Deltaproteobacteria bacterium]